MAQDSPIYWKNNRVEVRAAGFDPDRAAGTNTIVTIASAYTNAHRCNNRVREITDLLVQTIGERGGQGLIVGAPAVSDALTQGTPTAGYSLVSRDVAADCFEIGHYAHHGEAMIVISGCDKTGAAALMPLARTNAFGLVLYPGTSSPGRVSFEPYAQKGSNITIMDYAESRAAHESGRLSREQFLEIERNVMPGSGTCGAMFTANTMSTCAESMGMMLPRGASHPADHDAASPMHDDVRSQALASVDALYRLIAAGIRPRDIMTEKAFENAITTLYAMGGSTNLYLHLLAIAREAQVPITIDRIQAVGERVPLIVNLQPHGSYAMTSLHQLGGVPVVMKELLRHGFLHGDVMTVTGRTLAQNLEAVPTLEQLGDQDIVWPVAKPIAAPNNHISVLTGNLAPEKLRAQAVRQDTRKRRVPGQGAGIRIRGRHHGRDPAGCRASRRRGGGALRGADRRTGHARDGDADDSAARTGPGRRCRPDHRRPFLRRLARHPDRPCLAGSRPRRTDRRRARR